jgi:peptidoglycan/LPS O-acetylase OafA/YrhL
MATAELRAATAPLPAAAVASGRIHQLDGLRGLLALFVVCCHLSFALLSLRAVFAVWVPFLEVGWWYPVDVFFIMSGFVMLHVYGDTFAGGTSAGSWLAFMKVRVARLYPVHLAVMLLLLVCVFNLLRAVPAMAADGGVYSWRGFFAALFMLHSPWMEHRSWNYPSWSISAEWHAYVIFPFLVPLFRRMARGSALALVVIGALVPLAVYLQNLQPEQYPTNGLIVLTRVLPLFMCGMALYVLRKDGLGVPRWLAVLSALGTLLCLCLAEAAPFAVLLAPLFVYAVLQDRMVGGWFCWPPFLWLGKISYSLYMTHALIDIFFLRTVNKLAGGWLGAGWQHNVAAAFAFWLLAMALALVLGWATWRWIEVPCRQLILKRRAPAATVF